jgi:putative transposase
LHRFKWNAQKNGGKREHQVWQCDNYPTALWSAEVIWTKIRYIHRNPIRAGWVMEVPHYLYSSALGYTGEVGLLPVTLYEGIMYKT